MLNILTQAWYIENSKEITPENINEWLASTKNVNYLFFVGSKDCGFCTALKVTWERLSSHLDAYHNNLTYHE